MFHVGHISEKRPLLHVGDSNVRDWLLDKFAHSWDRVENGQVRSIRDRMNVYEILADVSRPIEMRDSKRTHDIPSRIADDCGLENVACYLRKNGERPEDLIRALENRGYNCIHYINKNESPGSDSWIVWNWSL